MRNKELTKRKIIAAVGDIFKEEGYKGIGINKIAKRAGVDKKLIYRYFNNIDELLEAYVIEKDYWMTFSNKKEGPPPLKTYENNKDLFIDLFQNQWKFFSSEPEMQSLIMWELTGESGLMKSIHNVREMFGQGVFKLTDEDFKNSGVNIRAVSALIVGGIYYAILHSRHNGNVICDVDVRSKEGNEEMLKTIRQIVEWAFEAGNKNDVKK